MTPRCASSATSDDIWVLHDHAVAARDCAGRLRLGHALDLDQAHPTGGDRVEQRVIAEARNRHAELLGGPDDQRALGH